MKTTIAEAAMFRADTFSEYSAWAGHLPFANWIVKESLPKKIVELGSHWGHSYFAFCKSVLEDKIECKCYAVDTWMGDEQAGLYGEKIYAHVTKHNEEFYSGFSTLLRKTFDEALDDICDGSIDLLHIDGLHTYEAVSNDFNTWLPKVKMGGYVLFHDTMVHSEGFGVWRLWNDLISKYPNHINFQHSFGLGVVQITTQACSTDSWLRPGSEAQQFMIDYFASLGDIYQVVYERDEAKRLLNKEMLRIKSMQNSLSWKITTPFRMLADALG